VMDKSARKNLDINVEYVTRVEGHGNIGISVRNGVLEKCRLDIIEAPRFFEAMVRGHSMFEVQHITSRICGICSIGHSLASVLAVEDAAGIEVSPQTALIRKLLLNLEIMDSHLLHFYFLVAPDAFGVQSVVPLLEKSRDVVVRALRMKRQLSDICNILAGRHTHPITVCVRGFTRFPSMKELEKMRDTLLEQQADVFITATVCQGIKLPDFERDTEYIGLSHPKAYDFMEGQIASTDLKKPLAKKDYLELVHEYHTEHSTAKHSKNRRDSYMTGALARINLNFSKMNREAHNIAQMLGFKPPCHNPFMNTVAQVIEYVQCYYESVQIIEYFLNKGIDREEAVSSWPKNSEMGKFKVKPGKGVGAIEVPRGLLIHEYEIDENGTVQRANCVIPTNQNLANIDLDLRKLIPENLHKSQEELILLSEMLVRAYDPCISCSTH
jgi:sulfhydrogenase subunit alpha